MPDKPDLFQRLFRKTKENLDKGQPTPGKKPEGAKPVNKAVPKSPAPSSQPTEKKVKIPLTGGKLDTYKTCPKRFQYQYLEKRGGPAETSHYLSFDTSLHHTLRDFYRDKTPKEGWRLDHLLALLERHWDGRGYDTPEDEREAKTGAENGLRKYFQQFCQTPARCIEIDYFFKIDLFGCEYSGRMDRVDKLDDNSYEIIDYKSGKQPAGGAAEIAANLAVQLLFLAADVIWPGKVNRITHVYLRDGGTLTVTRNLSAQADAKKTYLDIGEAIYQQKFNPVRSAGCGFCDFQEACPVGRIPNLTPSKLKMFLECPRRFAVTYVQRSAKRKTAEEPSFDLILDRLLHDSLAALYRDFKRGVHQDPQSFLMSSFYDLMPRNLPEDLTDLLKATGRELLNGYFLGHYQNSGTKHVNHQISVLTETFEFQAMLDRVDQDAKGNLTILDYRTGKRVPDPGELRLDSSIAATCFAARNQWQDKATSFTAIFLRGGEQITIEIDDFMVKRGQEILEEMARKIREKRFEAVPGFSCPRCANLSHCRQDVMALTMGKLQSLRDCPKKYKYQYIEKLAGPEGEKPALILSQIVHDTLRNIVAQSRLTSFETACADMQKRLEREKTLAPETLKTISDSATKALQNFFQNLKEKLPTTKSLSHRARASFEGMILNTTFDRVDILPNGKFEIVDYKTSKKALTLNEAQKELSGVFLSVVADSLWPGKIEKVTFQYLLAGSQISFTPVEPDIQRLKLALSEFNDEHETGAFEGNRNPLCPYCDYVDRCEDAKRLLLSPSKINAFQSCALKYKLNYIDRVPKEARPTPHLNFDRSIHFALKEFHQMVENKGLKQHPFRYLLGKHWVEEGFVDYEENERFKTRGLHMLEEYFKSLTGEENPILFETAATWKFGDLNISVQIDRVDELADGKFEIIDYKTGKKVLDERVAQDDTTLLNLYLAANDRWPGRVAKVSYYFMATGKKVSICPDAEHIEKHKKKIQGIVAEISAGDFQPNKGALCAWCEFYNPCPEWKVKPFMLSGETPEVFRKRLRLSYSKMGLFENCPRSYRKLYIDRVPPKSQPFFSFGTTIHETFENIYDPLHPIPKPSLEKVFEIYREVFNSHREGYGNEEVEKKYFDDGLRQVTLYYRRFIEDQEFQPAYSIEDYFEIPIGKYAVMTGFIDRIDRLPDGSYEILDYKTEPTDRTQDEVDHDKQLSIYYWACTTTMDMKISKLSLFMLDHDKKTTTVRSEKDLQKVVDHVDGMAFRMINEKDFNPKKNKYCKSCDHLHDCPLKEEILADQKLVSMKKF